MEKAINVSVIYNNQNKIFTCLQKDFLEKVAAHFHIDRKNITLYAVNKSERCRITERDIFDLMKVEIVDTINGNRTLRSYFAAESNSESFINTVITKLTNNTPLSGIERKTMVEWLKKNPPNSSNKRKHDDIDIDSRKETANKKVQANIFVTHSKDSSTQTDFLNMELNQEKEPDLSIQLKTMAFNGNADKEEAKQLMAKSFDHRRSFILTKIPPVLLVKEKYPLLFSLDEVKNELRRIFFPDICKQFKNNMRKYSKHIIETCDKSDVLYIRTKKRMENSDTAKAKIYAEVVGSVLILSKLLEEECRFIHLSDNAHGSANIFPHIDVSHHSLKEIFVDNISFDIYVEEQKLCEAPHFLDAVLCLVATFFIFNIDYPPSCRRTLTVFEKIYLCANDTTELDETTQQMVKMLQIKAK